MRPVFPVLLAAVLMPASVSVPLQLTGPASAAAPTSASASRIKDVAHWEGVQELQLTGFGVVVGLQGTGDSGRAALQALRDAAVSSDFAIDPRAMKSKNLALVSVTARLPAFARQDEDLDVTVSSTGDAKSLTGGVLLPTPMLDGSGVDRVHAAGSLQLGGFGASANGSKRVKNHLTTGRIPSGGQVVKPHAVRMDNRTELDLSLRERDWGTADRVRRTVNRELRGEFARALDSGTVRILVPDQYLGRVPEMVALLEGLKVETDAPSRIVINDRTGTVVVGGDVRIRPVAVAHGPISIEVDTVYGVSQPGAFARNGNTEVIAQSEIRASERDAALQVVEGVAIGDVVGALNRLGVSPQDLVVILQMIKDTGALDAEIVAH